MPGLPEHGALCWTGRAVVPMTRVHFTTNDASTTNSMSSGSASLRLLSAYGRPRYEDDRRLLFVLRESALNAEHELANMASVVLGQHNYRPEFAALAAAGIAPLREPHEWGGRILPVPKGSMSLIPAGNSWVLYALTSAVKDSAAGDNPFTTVFTRLLRELGPHAVVTRSVSRIVRHEDHVSAVAKALKECCTILDCTERVLDFRSHSAGADFVEIATDAIRERAGIVGRLESGVFTAADRGYYPFQVATLPIGYQRNQDREIVLGSAAQVKAVQRALKLLADPTVTVMEVANSLVAANAFRTAKAGRNSPETRPLYKNLSRQWVRRLLTRVNVYSEGIHIMQRTANSVSGGPSDLDGPAARPVAICRFDLTLPKGGWASPETFAAIRERAEGYSDRNRLRSTSPDKHSHQVPLAGYRWRKESTEYAVLSRRVGYANGARYVLAARPMADYAIAAQAGGTNWTRSLARAWGQPSASDPETQCMVSSQDLHRSIARVLGGLSTFEFAESATLLNLLGSSTSPMESIDDEVRAAEGEVKHAKVVRSRAQQAFYLAESDDPMLSVFKSDYAEAVQTIERLSARLDELRTRPSPIPAADSWSCSAGQFLAALARLHEFPDTLPRDVVSALHAVFYGFTLSYDRARGEVVWELALRLLTAEDSGERLTKMMSGRVAVSPVRLSHAGAAQLEGAAVRQALNDDVSDPQQRVHALAGLQARDVTGWGAASTLLDAPGCVRQVVIGHLLDEPADASLDPSYRALVLAAYLGNQGAQFRWNAQAELRQPILDALAHRGPMEHSALMKSLAIDATWETFDGTLRRGDGSWLGIALTDRYFVGASKNSGQRIRVMCRTCPHCGGYVDVVARVRECSAGLLCSACLRMPIPDSPEFPPFYATLAARPQARRPVTGQEPGWWSDLRRLHAAHADMTLTVLASSLGKRRFEVQAACETLGIQVCMIGGISDVWSDARLRHEYLDRDRKLIDLAFEIGVSTGTLSKRLRRARITKYKERTQAPDRAVAL